MSFKVLDVVGTYGIKQKGIVQLSGLLQGDWSLFWSSASPFFVRFSKWDAGCVCSGFRITSSATTPSSLSTYCHSEWSWTVPSSPSQCPWTNVVLSRFLRGIPAFLLCSRRGLGEGSATLWWDKLAVSTCALSSSPAAKPNPKRDCGQKEFSQHNCSWVLPRSRPLPGPVLRAPYMHSRQAVAVKGLYLQEVVLAGLHWRHAEVCRCSNSQGTTWLQKQFLLSIY